MSLEEIMCEHIKVWMMISKRATAGEQDIYLDKTGRDIGQNARIQYINWRGETSVRLIRPHVLRFGSTKWHPEEQWLLEAFDLGKNAERTFAVKNICVWCDHDD